MIQFNNNQLSKTIFHLLKNANLNLLILLTEKRR